VIKKILQKIFKVSAYSFFSKLYGKIDESIDFNTDKRIKVTNLNLEKKLNYKIYEVEGGRIYTDRIQDVAVIIDNKIIEGPSFQLRYKKELQIYNSNIKDNVVFTKGTPRILKNLEGNVLSLLTGGAGNDNYWHWLTDVLPRIALVNKCFNLDEINFFLLPNYKKRFQEETLDYLKIHKTKRISSEKFRHIKAKKIILTDHPVVVSGDSSSDAQNIPVWVIQWLKNNFLEKNINTQVKKKIYIDRDDKVISKSSRSIINEKEVREHLIKEGFEPIKLAQTSFREQVNLFNNADCIAGLHGAGFANIIFCRSGTKVIEFRNSSTGRMFENLAKKNNLKYKSIIIGEKNLVKSKKIIEKDINDKSIDLIIETSKHAFINQQGSIEIPINELKRALES